MKVLSIVLLAALVYSVSCATTSSQEATTEEPAPSTTSGTVEQHKAKLLEKAKKLQVLAEKEIKKLTEEGKTAAANVLKKDEEKVKKLVDELEAAKDNTALKKIEHELTQAEKKLNEQINKDKAHDNKTTHAPKGSTSAHHKGSTSAHHRTARTTSTAA